MVDDAVSEGVDGRLHLHRLQDDELFALLHLVTDGRRDGTDHRRDGGADLHLVGRVSLDPAFGLRLD